jgi:hypothetical protein
MAGGAIVQVESHAGWRPLVVVVDMRWGGVSGVPVRPGKRRGGGRGGSGDHFKSAHRGGGRPAEWHHTMGEG